MLKPFIVFCLILNFTMFSCIRFEYENPTDSLDYQPLKEGKFWIYQTEELKMLGTGEIIKSNYLLKDVVSYSFLNAEKDSVFVIERFTSKTENEWSLEDTYSLFIRNGNLIQNIDNQLVVILKFPPTLGLSWDSMIFNSSPKDIYKIILNGEYKLDQMTLDKAVKVEQEDGDDKITYIDKRYLIFGKNVGLVELYSEVFKYCSRNECLGKQVLESGTKLHLKLIEYGQN